MTAVQLAGSNYLALDVGDVRIGIAFAHHIARIASPLTTILNNDVVWDSISEIIDRESAGILVIGLPRNLSGEDTAQTEKVREFARIARQRYNIPIDLQDEALTSQKAEKELRARGGQIEKGDVDALSAVYILDDYLSEHPI